MSEQLALSPADTRSVAVAFGLGSVVRECRPVPGGLSHPLYRLRTERGTWAVKRLNRSREDWWWRDHLLAAAVERAALAAGVPLPRPVVPPAPAAAGSPLADLPLGGEPVSFLAWEWSEGDRLDDLNVPDDVRSWVGGTLATLHALAVEAPAGGQVHPPHPVEEWRTWLAEAPPATDPEFLRSVAGHLDAVAEAYRLVTGFTARLAPSEPVFTHRDVKPDNVLVTTRTPVLLDWEGAGPEPAPWEAARAALAFARTPDGWSRAGFLRVLAAYRAAGGGVLPADPAVFGGLLANRLGGAAFLLWRALGHRPVSAPERAAAHRHTLEYLAQLRLTLGRLDTWTGWLAELEGSPAAPAAPPGRPAG
ncbi:phosphotransferase [Streptomyces sp. DSM 44915]|uniref:Phosphotransferase n=1 Tax=Streptomyces chisholmiae TaxID=3075540 RepID=A0ABU2JNB2_9ACTN|nr:phosphotransferase [Streptomyces sp. DSM 44915]MDT0266480.1 phosphotransferase [Streptomyces sp. DSM 44915]